MDEVIFLKTDAKLDELLGQKLAGIFNKGDIVAVKLHMGEPGNPHALKPLFVARIIAALKKIGTKPFLFDSPVKYSGPRHTEEGYLKAAAEKGYTTSAIGCPIVVSNESIPVKGKQLTYGVCKPLADADGVLVLTHVKGHLCCGFGGAIKNLGMGAVTKESKGEIHEGGKPVYVDGCVMCGACEAVCPTENIRYADNRSYFDKNWCCGCSNCAIFCPEKAIKPNVDNFDFLLAEAAWAAHKHFKKSYYINVIRDIARLCDCSSNPGKAVLEDVGIVLGQDIVAVEKASLDLINKKAGKDLFEEIHHKSPLVHILEAKKLGMGTMDYVLSEF